MSTGWSVYVIVLIVVNVVGCGWLLFANRSVRIDPRDKGESTGHDFDGIEELNNPLPAWWTWLFIVTIVFSIGYFVLYPGFGSIKCLFINQGVAGYLHLGIAGVHGHKCGYSQQGQDHNGCNDDRALFISSN